MTTPNTPPTSRFHADNVPVDNPLPHRLAEGENATPLEVTGSTATDKLVIVMVGLPATGKTHIAKRICRFLSFFHDIPAQIFNVGDYRRKLCGAQLPAEFFNPHNHQAQQQRSMACNAALAEMVEYLRQDGSRVAAFDATNTTKDRRRHIVQTLRQAAIGCKFMFVESICDSEELLEENIRKVKLSTPDYRDMDPDQAMKDFKQRRQNYSSVYESVDAHDGPHVKIINSRRFIVDNIRGYLGLKVVHFVMNLHTLPKTFYFTRHGQSEYNVLGKIGGDSGLSQAGKRYAQRLAQFAKEHIAKTTIDDDDDDDDDNDKQQQQQQQQGNDESKDTNGDSSSSSSSGNNKKKKKVERPCRLWTSTLVRTKETASFIEHYSFSHTWDNGDTIDWVQFRPKPRRNLDELYAGVCDGMTYREIEQVFPEEFRRRQEDKLCYRYPRGESYMDVTLRLEPVAQEMERIREPVLIVAHQGILRILYAYFMGLDRREAPYVSIPLNNVIELQPHAYGCHEKRYCLMSKEEMLGDDGQDEPVTSMPVSVTSRHSSSNLAGIMHDKNDDGGGGGGPDQDNGKDTENNHEEPYPANDPVMNAPSC